METVCPSKFAGGNNDLGRSPDIKLIAPAMPWDESADAVRGDMAPVELGAEVIVVARVGAEANPAAASSGGGLFGSPNPEMSTPTSPDYLRRGSVNSLPRTSLSGR